jgi:hypothetical protein
MPHVSAALASVSRLRVPPPVLDYVRLDRGRIWWHTGIPPLVDVRPRLVERGDRKHPINDDAIDSGDRFLAYHVTHTESLIGQPTNGEGVEGVSPHGDGRRYRF